MTPRPHPYRPGLRALTVQVALALVGVLLTGGGASAAALPGLVDAPTSARVTFGLGPGGQSFLDKRAFLTYAGAPGSQLLDRVAVYNQSNQPLDLLVYPSDAANSATGGLDLLPRSAPNRGLGAWVALGAAATKATPAADGRSTVRVRVPAQSKQFGIGRVLVPLNVIVPQDVAPGDYSAGIVAALLSVGSSATAQNIELEQRVALRIYFRVAGDLKPRLAVKILKASYVAGSGLGLSGTARVRFQVRNTGNVRLGALTTLTVENSLGLASAAVVGPKLDELVPGGSAIVTADVPGVRPAGPQLAKVSVRAKAAIGNKPVSVDPATDEVRFWAVTWQEGVALVLLLLVLSYVGWRRRRRSASRARHAAPSRPLPVKAGAGAAAVVLLVTALAMVTPSKARAGDLGTLGVSPTKGSTSTLFFGYAEAGCPRGTTDSYWTIDGPDLPRDVAYLGPGNTTGTGSQQFRGASLANVRTAYPDSFRQDGTYYVRFSCVPMDGKVRDSYELPLRYRHADGGSWVVTGAKPVPAFVFDPSLPAPPAGQSAPAAPRPQTSAAPSATGATPGADGTPSPPAVGAVGGTQPAGSSLAQAPDLSSTPTSGASTSWWWFGLGLPLLAGVLLLRARARTSTAPAERPR